MHGFPARCRAVPGGVGSRPAPPERVCRPSDPEPRSAGPCPGGRLPSALHPAHRAGGGPVPRRADRAALSGPRRNLPCRRRTDGAAAEAGAELLGTPHSRAVSQLAFALLCELSGADSAAPSLPPLVTAAIEDIRQNYAGLYGVEELSERLGVSKSHLVRTFTAAVGVPPGRYLTTVRIEAAMRLLLHREYTLDVIASLCGFSGANYLCRVFKKETGHSPAQWRAMAGQAVRPLSPAESKREQELYI